MLIETARGGPGHEPIWKIPDSGQTSAEEQYEQENHMVNKRIFRLCLYSALVTGVCGMPVAANEKKLTWHVYSGITCTDATITGWHTTGTARLQSDDAAGDADVACSTTLTKDGDTDRTWTIPGGDASCDTDDETRAALDEIKDKTCAVVTKITWDGGSKLALYGGYQNRILTTPDMPAIALAHEVGHMAGLGDLNPTVTKRIMNFEISGDEDRVICSEKTKFEQL
ncbi:MAG: hypothetical protein NT031_11860 [Planctomycetota bacterium]|nr:hypothetical protein [Planctomycetota bacterium]